MTAQPIISMISPKMRLIHKVFLTPTLLTLPGMTVGNAKSNAPYPADIRPMLS